MDRFKGDYMMMVMELTDGAENEICFISTHLHPHTEKLGHFMQKNYSESQKFRNTFTPSIAGRAVDEDAWWPPSKF